MIKKIAEFDRNHGLAHDQESRNSLMSVVLAMRNTQAGRTAGNLKEDIRQVLFGS